MTFNPRTLAATGRGAVIMASGIALGALTTHIAGPAAIATLADGPTSTAQSSDAGRSTAADPNPVGAADNAPQAAPPTQKPAAKSGQS